VAKVAPHGEMEADAVIIQGGISKEKKPEQEEEDK
jgi:hypothetical protein